MFRLSKNELLDRPIPKCHFLRYAPQYFTNEEEANEPIFLIHQDQVQ